MARSKAIDTSIPAGTVVVSVDVNASPERVHAALTDPAVIRNWFGDLRGAMRSGARATLDFGDGDFFSIDDIHVGPGLIAYTWRFLGIMPADTIRWHIEPKGSGSRVTVTDSEPLRETGWIEELREGWKDFTDRLVEFLATGRSTRYDWRRSFEGGVELPRASAEVTDIGALPTRWLPVNPGLVVGAVITPGDELEPATVRIGELNESHDSVRFSVTSPQWRMPTECTIALRPRGANIMLTVTHTGWEGIDTRDRIQRTQRRRFAEMWIAALGRARDATASGSTMAVTRAR